MCSVVAGHSGNETEIGDERRAEERMGKERRGEAEEMEDEKEKRSVKIIKPLSWGSGII